MSLKGFRSSAKSFGVKVLMMLLVLSFIMFFGYNNVTSCSSDVIARVNSQEILQKDYESRVRSAVENYRRLLGRDLDQSIFGLVQRNVFEQLVNRAVLLDEADDLHIDVGNTAVGEEIRRVFSDPKTKNFDADFYKNYVQRYLQSSPKKFEDQIRGDLKVTRLQTILENSVKVSNAEVRDLYRQENRQLNFEFIKIDPNTMKLDTQPSDEQLKAFFDSRQQDYMTKELRKIEYVYLNPEDFGGEKGDNKINDEVEAALQTAADKLAATFKSNPDQPMKTLLGGVKATYGSSEFFSREDSLPGNKDSGTIVTKAFGLLKGEISEPTKGWITNRRYLIRVTDIHEPRPQTLDEARDSLVVNFAEAEKIKLAEKIVDELLPKVSDGTDLKVLANSFALEVEETGFFKQKDAKTIPNVGFADSAGEELFSLLPGDAQTASMQKPIKVAEIFYLFRVKEEKMVGDNDIEKNLQVEISRILDQKRQQFSRQWTESLRKQAEERGDIKIYRQELQTS